MKFIIVFSNGEKIKGRANSEENKKCFREFFESVKKNGFIGRINFGSSTINLAHVRELSILE